MRHQKKVVLKNVTPTESELSTMQLSPEDVELDTVQTWTTEAGIRQIIHSNDNFQEPPIPRQNKGKEKILHSISPARKKLRSSVTKAVQNSPNKKPTFQCQASRPTHAKTIPAKKKDPK